MNVLKTHPDKLPPGISLPETGNLHNNCFQPVKEVDDQTFWHTFSTYGPGNMQSFHSFKDLQGLEGHPKNSYIFWYHHKAFVVVPNYSKMDNQKHGYGFNVKYFQIGCDHKNKKDIYKPRNARDGWREELCLDCGYIDKYDCGD